MISCCLMGMEMNDDAAAAAAAVSILCRRDTSTVPLNIMSQSKKILEPGGPPLNPYQDDTWLSLNVRKKFQARQTQAREFWLYMSTDKRRKLRKMNLIHFGWAVIESQHGDLW